MINGPWIVEEEKTDWRGIGLYRVRSAETGREYLLEDFAMATSFKDRLYREVAADLEREIERSAAVSHPALRRPLGVTRHEDRYCLVRPADPELWRGWGPAPEPRDMEVFGAWLLTMAEIMAAYHEAGLLTHGIARADLVSTGEGVLVCEPISQACLAAYRDRERCRRHDLAPEVSRGAPWGQPADLFALGLNAYLMAAGRFPLTGEGAVLADNLLAETIVDPRASAPALGPSLARTILTLLDRKPGRRPTAASLAGTIKAQGQAGLWVASAREREEYARSGRRQADLLTRRERLRGLARRNRGLILAGVGVLAAFLLVYSLRGRPAAPVITGETSPAQVVAALYRAIDTLDQTLLEETLAPKVGKDIRQVVTTVFVIHRVSIAEGGRPMDTPTPLRVRDLAVTRVRQEPPRFVARYDLAMRKGAQDEMVDEIMTMEDHLTLARVKDKRVGEKWVIVELDRKNLGTRTVKVPPEEINAKPTMPQPAG